MQVMYAIYRDNAICYRFGLCLIRFPSIGVPMQLLCIKTIRMPRTIAPCQIINNTPLHHKMQCFPATTQSVERVQGVFALCFTSGRAWWRVCAPGGSRVCTLRIQISAAFRIGGDSLHPTSVVRVAEFLLDLLSWAICPADHSIATMFS